MIEPRCLIGTFDNGALFQDVFVPPGKRFRRSSGSFQGRGPRGKVSAELYRNGPAVRPPGVLRPARMVPLLAGEGTTPLSHCASPLSDRPHWGKLKGLPHQGDYFLPDARIREPFSITADPTVVMTLFEHDTDKLKGLAETLRSADIVPQPGRSPGEPLSGPKAIRLCLAS